MGALTNNEDTDRRVEGDSRHPGVARLIGGGTVGDHPRDQTPGEPRSLERDSSTLPGENQTNRQRITVALGEFGELVGRGLTETLSEDSILQLVTMPKSSDSEWPQAIILDGDRTHPSAPQSLRDIIPIIGIIVLANSAARIRRIRELDAHTTCLFKEKVSAIQLHIAIRTTVLITSGRPLQTSSVSFSDSPSVGLLLTPREREVLACVTEGLTHKAIAARLTISIETARSHTAHIRNKFGVHNNVQLMSMAIRLGLAGNVSGVPLF